MQYFPSTQGVGVLLIEGIPFIDIQGASNGPHPPCCIPRSRRDHPRYPCGGPGNRKTLSQLRLSSQ